MYILFWIIIIGILILLWFLLAFAFRPIGKLFYKLYKDVKEEINKQN